VICAEVINSSQIENNPTKQRRTINMGHRNVGFVSSAYRSVKICKLLWKVR